MKRSNEFVPRSSDARDVREEAEAQDVGSARLAQSRQRKTQQKMRAATLLMVIPTAAVSVMMMATAHVVFRDWRSYETEARIATAQRDALRGQLDTGQRRLSALRSVKGREQILVEHGFIRPGDRLLLFPEEPNSPESHSSNDLSRNLSQDFAARRAVSHATTESSWTHAARAMSGWLGSLSGGSKAATSTSIPPDSGASTRNAQSGTESGVEAEDGQVAPEDRIVRPAEDTR